MKPDLTTLEGNLAACNYADDQYVRMKENMNMAALTDSGCSIEKASAEVERGKPGERQAARVPLTKTEIHCREHKRERFEKMLERVYGFFRRKS